MSSDTVQTKPSELSRDSVIIRTSVVGIVANVLLAAFKAGVGFASNSIAVILDEVNNLSDALSSIITIVAPSLQASCRTRSTRSATAVSNTSAP